MSLMPLMVTVGIEFTNNALRRLVSTSTCAMLGHRAVISMVRTMDSTGSGHIAYLKILACPGCMTGYWVRMVE